MKIIYLNQKQEDHLKEDQEIFFKVYIIKLLFGNKIKNFKEHNKNKHN